MKFENKDTEIFMYLIKKFAADKDTYMLPTDKYYVLDPGKTLLGYYDEEYIYLIPNIITGKCEEYLTKSGRPRINIQKVLNTLFRANLIKVCWVMRKDICYRPEKRISGKRGRYITFIRKELKRGKEST